MGCRCGKNMLDPDGICFWCGAMVERVATPAKPRPCFPAVPVIGARARDQRQWTRTMVVAAIRRWHRETGRTPRVTDWTRGGPWWPGRTAVERLFPTWKHAVRAAGFEPPAQGRPAGPHT